MSAEGKEGGGDAAKVEDARATTVNNRLYKMFLEGGAKGDKLLKSLQEAESACVFLQRAPPPSPLFPPWILTLPPTPPSRC